MIANVKAAHLRWRKRMNSALGVWLFVGVVVGRGIWLAQDVIDRDAMLLGGAFASGLAAFLVGSLLTRMVLPKPDSKCPQCGHDFGGSDPNDDWLTWKCCPDCGFRLSNGSNEQEALIN